MIPKGEPWTAIVPVRSGSKGLPGKNTRLFAGRPLYQHAVDMAIAAGASQVIITTDIPEILALQFQSPVAVLERPAELCGDDVPMVPVLLHAMQAKAVQGPVVLLQVTSPLRQEQDIHAALSTLASGAFDVVMSVTEADRGVLKWGRLGDDGRYLPLSSPEHCFANRQSLPPVVKPNGAVYAMHAEWFVANQGLVTDRLGIVLMPPERSYDIDHLADFERCEALLTLST